VPAVTSPSVVESVEGDDDEGTRRLTRIALTELSTDSVKAPLASPETTIGATLTLSEDGVLATNANTEVDESLLASSSSLKISKSGTANAFESKALVPKKDRVHVYTALTAQYVLQKSLHLQQSC
jgi:hypothetical protein